MTDRFDTHAIVITILCAESRIWISHTVVSSRRDIMVEAWLMGTLLRECCLQNNARLTASQPHVPSSLGPYGGTVHCVCVSDVIRSTEISVTEKFG